jgi:hypothetical protein
MFEEYESDVDSSIGGFTASVQSSEYPEQPPDYKGPPDRGYPSDAEPGETIDPATTFQVDGEMCQTAFARRTDLEHHPGYHGESESKWNLRFSLIMFTLVCMAPTESASSALQRPSPQASWISPSQTATDSRSGDIVPDGSWQSPVFSDELASGRETMFPPPGEASIQNRLVDAEREGHIE